jgi:hypothetical protein
MMMLPAVFKTKRVTQAALQFGITLLVIQSLLLLLMIE